MLSVEEIQLHFIAGLNGAIRRPGMYGGEIGLEYMLEPVVYVTETGGPRTWREALDAAGAWSSIGVSGVVERLLPGGAVEAIASVYADYAHRHGWLTLDRTLGESEYDDLREQLPQSCAMDRAGAEIVSRFGVPSVQIGGSAERALGYGRPGEPLVWFHLSQEHVVLAGRCGEPFVDSFRFTPRGQLSRPVPEY